jgi:hypothetical protein
MDTESIIRWIVTCGGGGGGGYYQPPPPPPSSSTPPKYLYVIFKDGKGFVVPIQSYEEYLSLKDKVSSFSAFIHNVVPAYRIPTGATVVSAEELMDYCYSLYSPGGSSPSPKTDQTPAPSQPPSGGQTPPSEPIRSVSTPTPRQLDVTKVVLWGGIALGVLILVVLLRGD